MTVMTSTPGWLSPGPITRADLDAMPDDGHRYELLGGALIVTPAPSPRHQTAVGELFVALRSRAPDDLVVLMAPLDVTLSPDTVMQPDVVVARREDLTERDLPTAPILAVEVLSPSTRGIDLVLKRGHLQRAGCPHYWIVDPLDQSITALRLVDGAYVEAVTATGDDLFEVSEPFAVEFAASSLFPAL
ncbi:MAG: Uma2 family endonuclease [Gordonia sp. (in: high G+C Gram-positive bacteria)]